MEPSTQSPLRKASPRLTLWQIITEDWQAHGCDWTRPGFRAIAVYRYGHWVEGIASRWVRGPLKRLYLPLFRHVRNHYGIELPAEVVLGRRVVIEHQHGIVVHGNCQIGDDCILRQGVTLGNRYLERPLEAPCLGKRVNIGAGAKILGKVVIGDDVNIGANAVVLKDVPSGYTAIGIPAMLIPPSGR